MTAVEEAAAEMILELAEAPLTKLLANVDAARKAMKSTDPMVASVGNAFSAASVEAMDYMLLILQNNPRKGVVDALSREDVHDAFDFAFVQTALPMVHGAIDQAWELGWAVGDAQATADVAVWGLPDPVVGVGQQSNFLLSLHDDAEKNGHTAHQRMQEAVENSEPGDYATNLSRVVMDLLRRAVYGVDAARSRAATEAKLARYSAAGVSQLLWVTHFKPTTCGTCASLHGRVIDMGDTFDPGMTWASSAPNVYMDLDGPPRHPNCGCDVVAYVATDKQGGVSPATMTTWAAKWWAEKGKT